MGVGTRLLLLFLVVFLFLFYGWFTVRRMREQELLKSKLYADAVLDWEKIQAWFVRDFQSDFKPFPILLDTGGWVAREVIVRIDEDGKLFIPLYLNPAEFVVAVRLIKEHFDVDF